MSTALDIAIAIAFLYMLLALIVTTVQELIASVLNLRARSLYNAIEGMFKDGTADGTIKVKTETGTVSRKLVDAVYHHPLIKNLYRATVGDAIRKQELPSYIPSEAFARAFLDVLRGDTTVSAAIGLDKVLTEARRTIAKIENNRELTRVLTLLLDDLDAGALSADAFAAGTSKRIETWFNDRMARATGWYKRRAQAWALCLALAATLLCNADSIRYVQELWNDAALRDAAVASAQAYRNGGADAPELPSGTTVQLGHLVVRQVTDLESLHLPIGWTWEAKSALPCVRGKVDAAGTVSCQALSWGAWGLVMIGWVLTALAVSLGANFWFDVLSKVLNLRGAGARVSSTNGSVTEKQG
jgi:hypothetical protein